MNVTKICTFIWKFLQRIDDWKLQWGLYIEWWFKNNITLLQMGYFHTKHLIIWQWRVVLLTLYLLWYVCHTMWQMCIHTFYTRYRLYIKYVTLTFGFLPVIMPIGVQIYVWLFASTWNKSDLSLICHHRIFPIGGTFCTEEFGHPINKWPLHIKLDILIQVNFKSVKIWQI